MRLSTFLFFLVLSFKLFGQQQYPTKIKWKYIKTKNFKVVFPAEIEPSAQKAVSLLENSKTSADSSYGITSKRIPVLLNNQSVISNGFVSLAPRYMCWYLTPPQDISTSLDGTDWLYLLSLHEQRHVSQFDKLNKNFTDFLSDITGDIGRAIAISISVPSWYMEGDAVTNETIYSYSGRGRMPSFIRDYYTLEESNKRYSYDKAFFGSYKDFTPNYYKLGYLMVNHVNRNYSSETWNKVLEYSSAHSYSPFSFSHGLKKETGYNLKKTYINTLNEYDSIWKSNLLPSEDFSYTKIKGLETKQGRTDYLFPQYISKDTILALKSGYSSLPTLVFIVKNNETPLKEINYIDRIQTNGKYVVWNQPFYHIRWGEKLYSDIMVLNLKTGKSRRLTKKQKLFAPSLSPDGNKIVAIEYNEESICSLVFIDFNTGEILKKIQLKENEIARMPEWDKSSKSIVFTSSQKQTKQIKIISYESEEVVFKKSFSYENISNPVFYDNYILFNSTLNGIDQIHALNTKNDQRFIVVKNNFGAYNPQISESGKMAFQEFSSTGYNVCTENINPDKFTRIQDTDISKNNYLYHLTPIIKNQVIPVSFSDSTYTVKKYSPLLHSFFIHSWYPSIGYRRVGFYAFSNDILNNLNLTMGFNYYPRDVAHQEYISFSYARYFPILNLEFSHGKRYKFDDSPEINEYLDLNENILDFSITFPFILSRGNYSTTLDITPGFLSGYQHFNTFEESEIYESDINIESPHLSAEFSRLKTMRIRDINPQYGQEISLIHINSLDRSTVNDSRTTLSGILYFPGFINHHSITLQAGLEVKGDSTLDCIYLTSTKQQNIIGYNEFVFNNYQKYTFNYTFPLFYPDFNLGSILYIPRVYSSVFYDMGIFDNNNQISSVGCDINFEFYLFRIPVAFDMGLRYAYRLKDNQSRIELLFFRQSF